MWEPKSGTILDLSTRYVLPLEGPQDSEEYTPTTTGSKIPIKRTHSVQIPVTHSEAASLIPVIQRFDCPVKAAFLGEVGTDSWMWLEPSKLQVTDPTVEPTLNAERVLEIESSVFFPAIWEGVDITEGVPWRATEDVYRDNRVLRPKGNLRPDYEGPLWQVNHPDASVDYAGNADLGDGHADLYFEFPVWGSTVELGAEDGTLTGYAEALGWDGSVIAGPDKKITLPEKTWKLHIQVSEANRSPVLHIRGMSEPYGVLEGTATPDCTRVTTPIWKNSALVITDET